MQIMLGDATGDALSMLNLQDRRGEAASLWSSAQGGDTGLGNWWAMLAQYAAAPPKGGTQIVRRASQGGIQPKHLAVGALAAAAAYLALG